MKHFWRQHGGKFERWYPSAGALIASIVAYLAPPSAPNAWMPQMLPVIATVAGVFAAFATTALAILTGIVNTEVILTLKRLKLYERLVGYFVSAARSSLIALVVSLGAVAATWSDPQPVLIPVIAAVATHSFLTAWRTVSSLWVVMRQL